MSSHPEGDFAVCPMFNAPQHAIGSGFPCLICSHHHLTEWNIIPPWSTITGVREELSISWYPLCPCNPIPLLPFFGIIFPLEPIHLAMEGEGGKLLMTAAREAGGNGLGGGGSVRGISRGGTPFMLTGGVRYGRWSRRPVGDSVFWLCLLVASTNS